VTVRVVCYARIRELVGADAIERTLPVGATVGDCFDDLTREVAGLAELGASTRFVRGTAFVDRATELHDGDELGLLPPFGGG